MATTYRFCLVDPGTWRDNRAVEDIEGATIVYDLGQPTRGNMTFTVKEEFGESYIRSYIVQDGRQSCIGTFLAQTSKKSHNGRRGWWDVASYTPLLELADDMPPIGYYAEGGYVLDAARQYIAAHCRAPVASSGSGSLLRQAFAASSDETNLDFIGNLIDKDDCYLMVEPDGTIVIMPNRAASAMQPVHRFTDDDASVIDPDVEDRRDLYGIPNVIEVVGTGGMSVEVRNEDPASPLSIQNRGRVIRHREQNPNLPDGYTQDQLREYAQRQLDGMSHVEHEVKFSFGWMPNIRVGCCVHLDFDRSGIHTLAIVRRMEMPLTAAAKVTCTATYTEAI